jgi:hypothetical protein
MKQCVRRIIFVMVGLVCFLSIIAFSGNKYEWMLVENPNMALPLDDDALEVSFIGLAPLILFVLCLAFAKNKLEKTLLIIFSIILLCFWIYKCRFILFFIN